MQTWMVAVGAMTQVTADPNILRGRAEVVAAREVQVVRVMGVVVPDKAAVILETAVAMKPVRAAAV